MTAARNPFVHLELHTGNLPERLLVLHAAVRLAGRAGQRSARAPTRRSRSGTGSRAASSSARPSGRCGCPTSRSPTSSRPPSARSISAPRCCSTRARARSAGAASSPTRPAARSRSGSRSPERGGATIGPVPDAPLLHRLRRGERADRLRPDGAAGRLRARPAGDRAEGVRGAAGAARAARLDRRRGARRPPTSSRSSARKPAIHRYPGSMAERVHDLAVHVRDDYDGDAARVWTDAADGAELRANIAALPGFGEMKVKALGSVLAKRFGVEAAAGPGALASDPRRRRLRRRRWPTTRRPSAPTRPSGRRRKSAPSRQFRPCGSEPGDEFPTAPEFQL